MRKGGVQMEDNTTLIVMETNQDNSYGSITMSAPVQPPDRNVFSDRATRVDYVLVWEEPRSSQDEQSVGVNPAHRKWREEFLRKLKLCGLLQEQKIVLQTKIRICFVLLSAPWSVLSYFAEEISLRVPLQVVHSPNMSWSEQVLSWLSLPNPLAQDVPNPPLCYYTCQFRPNKLPRFLGSDHKETFFKTTQRHQVLYEILARTPYGCVSEGQVGVDRLLSEHVFTAAYPLHEGGFQPPPPPRPPQSHSLRQVLYSHWARWSCWRRYQPLDHIRDYFGEKIALYFAWLGFYTAWLLPASLLGTLIFMVGICLMVTDVPAKEVCDSGDGFVMCPTCNICSFWNYSSICVTYKVGILFDNGGTVFLSVFMSLWAVTFLEYWKRNCSALSDRWNCSDFQEIEERPRPEFTAMAPMTMRNPVTGAEEPYFPENKRFNRTLSGCIVIIIMIVLVLMCLMAIILCRSILSILIYKSSNRFFSFSVVLVLMCLMAIILCRSILSILIYKSSNRFFSFSVKMHRTQSKYEDMFILKVFIFQFVNFYSSPVYIAFFKGRFVGYPGNYKTLFGVRNEDCGAGGCLVELAQELLVIVVGKQLINNIQEFIVPKLKSWWQKRRMSRVQREMKEEGGEEAQWEQPQQLPPWEADYQLLVCDGLLSEYLEMVIQFGFITIFVAACPLAPFFALINNWVEIRLDAQKFVTEYRRPVVEQAQDIGIWLPIMQFITHTAVLSNAFLIAFTSSFLPRLYYRYTRDSTLSGFVNFTLATSHNYTQQDQKTSCRYPGFRDENGQYLPHFFHLLAIQLAFVIIFEHVVFFIGRLIDMMVPDVPEEVEMKIKREHYMAKRALAENRTVTDTMFPGEQDPLSRSLRQRGSRPSQPTQNEFPPPNLKKIPEETDSRGSC